MMGASQIDRYGNTNIANIGPWAKPKSQLLGVRGGPGNTVNNATSFFIPKHQTSVFVPVVDMVSGVGYDRAKKVGGFIAQRHDLRRVITNLGVFDFNTPDHAMRLVTLHPGVSLDDVVSNTGFELVVPAEVLISRGPTAQESAAINIIDPKGLRLREVAS